MLEKVKRLTIEALFSDDIFMGILVLKGGNALNLAYDISDRGSIDIDFSIAGDFSEQDKNRMRNYSESILNEVFEREGLHAFDVKFKEKPKSIHEDVQDFWGGYMIEFKLISLQKMKELGDSIEDIRRNAIALHDNNSNRYTIDISKYEHLGKVSKREIDGTIVQVYSPEMIVLEKLRAICQQNEDYRTIVKRMTSKSRARDFYDIYTVLSVFPDIDIQSEENKLLAKEIFAAKKVPFRYIAELEDYREKHRDSWESVRQTVSQDIDLQDFDFYFDFVKETFSSFV